MAIDETKIVVIIILFLSILTVVIVNYQGKTNFVKIIYFRRTSCIVVNKTDEIIADIENKLGDRIDVKTVNLDNDLTEEEKQLKEEHQVIGVPEIIINGKEYTKEFTKEELGKEICNKFLIKPEGCR